jgi:predicted naringenin-chalcone synthase
MKSHPPTIIGTATAVPSYTKSTEEILGYLEEFLKDQEERFRQKVMRIFKYAQVDRRYAIMSAEDVFRPMSFEEKNRKYVTAAKSLSEEVLRKALEDANTAPGELDYIITVSCTGFMIPSVDAYLINSLGLSPDIVRLPVTEMGCVGGVSGLIYAEQFLKANPNKKAAVVAVEAPSATFQRRDFSMTNMVSAAIFGDGAAAVILSSHKEDSGPVIRGSAMYHFYNETEMMGFEVVDSGFQMVLDVEVPEKIAEEFEDIIHPFLQDNGLQIQDIDHLIFHPGGKKIVRLVEDLFSQWGNNIEHTKEVLRQYGNMSSATVLFVLHKFLQEERKPKEKGLMLSFGPGFTAQRILLEWQ